MGVPGVPVAHEGAGELCEYPTGVDVLTSAPADVHQRQVLGAGHVHIRQRPGGPSGGLISVQHRGRGQQGLQVRQEGGFQQARGTSPDTGGEPGGHPDPGQDVQHVRGPPDRKVMPAGQQRRQRGGLWPNPDRASRTQHQRHHGVRGDPSPGGRRARLGHGLGGARLGGARLGGGKLGGGRVGGGRFRGTGLARGIGGGTHHVTAGVHRTCHIGGGGVIDLPTPATTPRHQLVLGDLRWWRRLHIHHLATHPRGLSGAVQRPRTPGTPLRSDLERLIRVLDQTP